MPVLEKNNLLLIYYYQCFVIEQQTEILVLRVPLLTNFPIKNWYMVHTNAIAYKSQFGLRTNCINIVAVYFFTKELTQYVQNELATE